MIKQRPNIDEAIAEVISAAGYTTLAAEWRTRPDDRGEIIRMVTKMLQTDSRFKGKGHAEKFTRLVAWRHAIKSHAAA